MKKRKISVSILGGVLAAVLLLSLLAGIAPTQANAASSSEIRQQINALEDKKAEIQAQADALEQQMSDTVSDIEETVAQKALIDQKIFLLYEEIDTVNEQIAAYRVLIADKQDELDEAQAAYDALSDQYRERVRAMEEEGTLSYWSVLFKANSFADLLDRLNMIEEIAAADRNRLQELNNAAKKVADAQAELEEEKAAMEEKRAELNASQEELEQERAAADELLSELVAKGEEYEAYLEKVDAQKNEILMQIATQEAAYDEAVEREYWATYVPPTTTAPPTSASSSNGNSTTSTEENSTESGSSGSSGGSSSSSSASWLTPVPYYTLTSPFGYRTHPISGVYKLHAGVDLACAAGTEIYASRSGTVTSAGYDSSMGYYVQIDHGDNYRSIYMHMTRYIVSAGQRVTAGQVIGYVGSTGAATGPHLHFGIYDKSQGCYVNPMAFI